MSQIIRKKLVCKKNVTIDKTLITQGNAFFTQNLDVTRNMTVFGNLSTENIVAGSGSIQGLTIGLGGGDINTNTALGYQALLSNTTGFNNTAIGYQSLTSNTTGFSNIALGYQSLFSNIAIGQSSLFSNVTGAANVALGQSSQYYNIAGIANVAIGQLSLFRNIGNYNTAIGFASLTFNTTGSNNTCIGNGSNCSTVTIDNEITLGNASISALRCATQTISALSDVRDKTNIVPLADGQGLSFVNLLSPVTFDWNMRDGAKVGIADMGFIAQDLQQVQLDANLVIPRLVYDVNPDKLEASYSTLLPIMVQSIKDLTTLVKSLESEILILKAKISQM